MTEENVAGAGREGFRAGMVCFRPSLTVDEAVARLLASPYWAEERARNPVRWRVAEWGIRQGWRAGRAVHERLTKET